MTGRGSFRHRLRVRYSECDPQGVVFNGNYFTHFDVAIAEFHRRVIGEYADLIDGGLGMVVAEASARYRAPAHFDEELDIELTPEGLGDRSLTIQLVVKRAETVIVEGELRYVFVSAKTRKMHAVPVESAPRVSPLSAGRSQGVGERGPSMLVVFSGLPGTGKTVLAEATARARQLPAFSVAWILGALAPFGILESKRRRPIAYALLTMLVRRQWELGQSAMVDGMVGQQKVRSDWFQLAQRNGAVFLPIECVCSDEELHRQRIEARRETSQAGWIPTGATSRRCVSTTSPGPRTA